MAKQLCLITVLLTAALGLWSRLSEQTAPAPRDELAKQVEAMQKRLDALERRGSPPSAAPAVDSRLDRIENRLTRLEERSLQYRSGDPPPGSYNLLERRIQVLEQEVARLRR
ncbi:MAG: hypothetical protein HY238_10565 [Acidobacteria bacterium]|nr:hypothetical protein [Acidobacteriota bacterium]